MRRRLFKPWLPMTTKVRGSRRARSTSVRRPDPRVCQQLHGPAFDPTWIQAEHCVTGHPCPEEHSTFRGVSFASSLRRPTAQVEKRGHASVIFFSACPSAQVDNTSDWTLINYPDTTRETQCIELSAAEFARLLSGLPIDVPVVH